MRHESWAVVVESIVAVVSAEGRTEQAEPTPRRVICRACTGARDLAPGADPPAACPVCGVMTIETAGEGRGR
jgi:rubrerythrin